MMSTDKKIPEGPDSNFLAQYAEGPTSNINGKPKYYKPFVLWTPTLSVLLGVTIILIAITELACQRLPNAENRGLVGSLNNRTGIFEELLPRQVIVSTAGPFTGPADGGDTPTATPSPIITEPPISDPTPIASFSISTEVTKVNGVEYTIEVTYGPPPAPTGTETQFSTGGPAEDNWLRIGTRTIGSKPADSPSPDSNGTPGEIPAQKTDSTLDVNGQPTPASDRPASPIVTPATFIPVATTILDTLGNAITTTVPVALDSAGSTILIPSGLISADATTTFLLTPSPTPGFKDNAGDDSGAVIHVFTKRDYIVGAFLPTVIAVLFAIPWGLIDTAAKEMEPIYQLAIPGGASATNSLSLNYAGASMFVAPFQAFSRRHWMIFVTSILSLLSLLTAPLAVESIFISLTGTCNADTNGLNCIPTLSVYKTAARVLEGVLASMALLLALLIFLACKRSSNVAAEPHSLAGVSSLMHNQKFLNIIRELPSSGIKEKALLGLLPPHRYTIGHYQNADGTWGYGFMLSRDISSPTTTYTNSNTYANANLHNNIETDSLEEKTTNNWNRFSRIFQVLGFGILLFAILVVVIYYRFFKSENGFGRFMSNQKFGVKFLFTSLGVIVAQFWAYAREKIHRNEPYHNLARGNAKPQNSILISPSLAPITSIFTSLRRFAPLLILLDLSTILADALIITLSNIPYSSATTFEAWTVCSYLSLAILSFMLFTLFIVLIRIGRFGSSGQDVPNTVVGKCVLLCGSFMLEKFEGLGEVKGGERRTQIEGWGKVYGAGRVRGVDGVVRKGVDFEEFIEGGRGRN